jgi:23S rRNA (adenine2503-C2)-methyltransferase
MSNQPRQSVYDLTFPALATEMSGLATVHAKVLWRTLHREAETRLSERDDFQRPLRQWIEDRMGSSGRFYLENFELADESESSDRLTRKFLLRLSDGQTIETVLMGYNGRHTACVSTQAGCAMGCVFLRHRSDGFRRHLRPGEIVRARCCTLSVRCEHQGREGLRNLVLMGMGEPLHNYDSVMTALEIISDRRGINIGPSRITISTVGVVPGILRLADEQAAISSRGEPARSNRSGSRCARTGESALVIG